MKPLILSSTWSPATSWRRPASQDELIETVWTDRDNVDTRTVDLHISHLRKVLKTALPHTFIRTIRSAGYTIEEPPR
ncbi:helix-turn-helix domain-containing protein [Mesorhizobium abyssinicae]|uniref:helix-turn-helix domain-containing protein n=1 Tax=Mesorhizobium abyssinicae TaxID=1209958 RepID=UPI003395239B